MDSAAPDAMKWPPEKGWRYVGLLPVLPGDPFAGWPHKECELVAGYPRDRDGAWVFLYPWGAYACTVIERPADWRPVYNAAVS